MISDKFMPACFVADVDAALQLCALKMSVSIPASLNVALTHLAIVSLDTGLWGL